jgi:ribonuclease III
VLIGVINYLRYLFSSDKNFTRTIKSIIGVYPGNIALYKLSLTHSSNPKGTEFIPNNERLEFLGDSVLGAVVAEYLFKKYPYKDEGFLTEIRSRLVNGDTCEMLASKIGIRKIIDNQRGKNQMYRYVYGDAFEAFLGAVYLDKGYIFTRDYIISVIKTHLQIDSIVNTTTNFKSKLIEWAQREGKTFKFEIAEEKKSGNMTEFFVHVMVDDKLIAEAKGSSKKKAEQFAAEKACTNLNL